MSYTSMPTVLRRYAPRIPTETFCTEYLEDRERYGLIVDLSHDGLRVQRPLDGAMARGPVVQIEFGLPEVDEIVWAKGEICFDQLWRARDTPSGAVRTTGIRLISAAQRHLRMLREYVHEMHRARLDREEEPWFTRAAGFRVA
jgi:hypothetical protein